MSSNDEIFLDNIRYCAAVKCSQCDNVITSELYGDPIHLDSSSIAVRLIAKMRDDYGWTVVERTKTRSAVDICGNFTEVKRETVRVPVCHECVHKEDQGE